jgi:hypothetical protein
MVIAAGTFRRFNLCPLKGILRLRRRRSMDTQSGN